jgi:membrane-associated phospholipid phosphatase
MAARASGPLPGDLAISLALQGVLSFSDTLMTLWRWLGLAVQYLPYVLIVISLLLRQWAAAVLLALAFFPAAFFAEDQLKAIFARPRPAAELVKIYQPSRGLSFPSGTALQTMVVIGTLIYLLRGMNKDSASTATAQFFTGFSILFLLLSSIARIHVGAHWASDILGGWLFGGAWALLLIAVDRWWTTRDRSK